MSIPKDIAEFLENNEIGTVGTNIFYGFMPPEPDAMIGVFEYAGSASDGMYQIDRPGLNIRVRGEQYDYENARTKIETIETLLKRIGQEDDGTYAEGVTINSTLYLRILPNQSPFPLGRDDNGRMEFSQNFTITK